MVNDMEKASYYFQTNVNMMENFKIMKLMDMEFINGEIIRSTVENGKIIK